MYGFLFSKRKKCGILMLLNPCFRSRRAIWYEEERDRHF
ncbi:hypothetical protein AB434_1176 [Heyndrickxia coagulans]|uniref:Uncharacterized protein n=1 Tax=Heyndrickxia coagulans TaxID=1398 RepID=A0AAN0T8Q8_HEYCO|nr:hypothetical protein SB48_HM08orf06629 [Heyndrickxia coagulans]AKN53581.1 hypothetical protein AB434_1176 [Heyndrickxia coagulans]KYC66228.1 hypothetical protein B4100_1343 [Heyndrickxia coagulans]KYC73522.1 hypothetical protein B4096_1311 [Heyndrickxia coagulans]